MTMGAASLLELDTLSAVFKAGTTALGHHWLLSDGDGNEVARTKLYYEGAGSREYHLLVERRPDADPLRTLVALAPVLAAYAY